MLGRLRVGDAYLFSSILTLRATSSPSTTPPMSRVLFHDFTKAAQRLDITRSGVSKHIAGLEAELGVQLLMRTTRKLSLTDVGERVYASCARIAEDVESAREAALTHRSQVAGHLRIAAPLALGRDYVVPLVGEFLALHPHTTAELLLADSFADLVEDRIDVALRVGRLRESSLVSRKLNTVRLLLCASPPYLSRHGHPKSPEALAEHAFILHGSMDPMRVTLQRGKRAVTVLGRGRLSSRDGPAAIQAALLGHGIVLVPDFEVGGALRSGALVAVLPEWRLDEMVMHAVFPPRKHVASRVRTFVDFLAERWKKPPWRT